MRERETSDLQAAYKTAIRFETLKKSSSATDAETALAPKEDAKPSKAPRTEQELTGQINLNSVKEETLWQMKKWHAENNVVELEPKILRRRPSERPG